jgi:hypothetical protein
VSGLEVRLDVLLIADTRLSHVPLARVSLLYLLSSTHREGSGQTSVNVA